MKKNIAYGSTLILLFLFIVLSSCISSQSFVPVKGKGAPVERSFTVSGYSGIDVSGGFDVILVQGAAEGVVLTAQENLFEHITVKVDQGTLKIYTENNIMATQPMKARITYKSIENLKVSGGGDVTGETPVNVPRLDVTLSGGGDMTTMINTDELSCHISGGGDAAINGNIKKYDMDLSGGGDIQSEVTAGGVYFDISGGGDVTLKCMDKATEGNIKISGGGDLTVDINAGKLYCSVSGGGDASLSGQASEFEITVNGGGDIHADRLATTSTVFHASGGSDVYVNVSAELNGEISGGGDVYYSGSPDKVTVNAKGGSEIHKQ
jgi:hypothetical protein